MTDLQYFIDHGGGKKIYLDEVRSCVLPSLVLRLAQSLMSMTPCPVVERLAIHRCWDSEYKTPKQIGRYQRQRRTRLL